MSDLTESPENMLIGNMTPKQKVQLNRARIDQARRCIELLEHDIKRIYIECGHPNIKRGTRSIMGRDTEDWEECPDCGYRRAW